MAGIAEQAANLVYESLEPEDTWQGTWPISALSLCVYTLIGSPGQRGSEQCHVIRRKE